MWRYTCGLICLFLAILSPLPATIQEDIHQLDEQIQVLEERKRVLNAKIYYASSEADRILFEDWLQYRENIQKMERFQAELKIVEMQLETLKAQRAELQATLPKSQPAH